MAQPHNPTTTPKAPANGSLGGSTVTCPCGFTATTSLSHCEADQIAAAHVAYMARLTPGRREQELIEARRRPGDTCDHAVLSDCPHFS